jgi:multiple sugar transport system substrate-binding protein
MARRKKQAMGEKREEMDRSSSKGGMPGSFMATLAVLALTGILLALWWTFDHDARQNAPLLPRGADEKPLAGQKVTALTHPNHARAFRLLGQWFYEETGGVVQSITTQPSDMLGHFERDMASTQAQLDVVTIRYYHLGRLTEQHMLADVTSLIERHKAVLQPEDYLPALYDVYTEYGGKRWALPFDGDTHLLFFRKSLLNKYGFSPPATWDDYFKIARTITENEKVNGIYGTAIMMHPFVSLSVASFLNRLYSYGGALLDADLRPALNSPQATAALAALVEQAAYALPSSLETDYDVSREAFLAGKVAMVEQWTNIGILAEDPAQSLIQGDWGVVPMPRGNGPGARHAVPLNSGFSLAVSSKAPNPDAARAFLLFASRPDIALRLNLANVTIDPTRVSVLQGEPYRRFAPEVSAAAQEALAASIPWPRLPQAQELLEVLADHLLLAAGGQESPQQALDAVQERWVEILGKRGK